MSWILTGKAGGGQVCAEMQKNEVSEKRRRTETEVDTMERKRKIVAVGQLAMQMRFGGEKEEMKKKRKMVLGRTG
jgi:hypothetical protein